MGKRGPARTPTNILKMRGSWLADTRVDEPQPEKGRPTCPAWLDKEAKRYWREIAPQLETMGILGKCDRGALARYCRTWAKWRQAEEFLMEHGDYVTIRNAEGQVVEIKEPPQVARAIRLGDQLLRLEQQFGLTPSARASMAITKENPEENRGRRTKERFFNGA